MKSTADSPRSPDAVDASSKHPTTHLDTVFAVGRHTFISSDEANTSQHKEITPGIEVCTRHLLAQTTNSNLRHKRIAPFVIGLYNIHKACEKLNAPGRALEESTEFVLRALSTLELYNQSCVVRTIYCLFNYQRWWLVYDHETVTEKSLWLGAWHG